MNRTLPVSLKTGKFTRQQRLTRPEQFKRVFKKPVRVGNEVFTILGQNNQKPTARLGLAIARKHVKSAVGRNRIKRLVRESFREHKSLLAGIDVIVTLRSDASRLDNEAIRNSLKKHWLELKEKCEQY